MRMPHQTHTDSTHSSRPLSLRFASSLDAMKAGSKSSAAKPPPPAAVASSPPTLGADLYTSALFQATDLKTAIAMAKELIEERDQEIARLHEELRSVRDKNAETFRSSARRMAQIALLERSIENGKRREAQLEHELERHGSMMDQVLNYRDKESAGELAELRHENAELSAKMERWKERAQQLQQERWSFVQKWKVARGRGAGAEDAAVEEEEDDDEDEGEAGSDRIDSDDDW